MEFLEAGKCRISAADLEQHISVACIRINRSLSKIPSLVESRTERENFNNNSDIANNSKISDDCDGNIDALRKLHPTFTCRKDETTYWQNLVETCKFSLFPEPSSQ